VTILPDFDLRDRNNASAIIHPTAVLTGGVEVGEGTSIGPYCVLVGPLRIGKNCSISAHCTVGTEPEHRLRGPAGLVTIGDDTVLRENCVIHRGTGQRNTSIGSCCYIMNRTYIAHDCLLADHVTVSAGVSLGGHVTVLEGANIGMNAAVHQFCTIGGYSMVGMSTPVTKDIPPFAVVAGNPARLLRVNTHALNRLQLDSEFVVHRDRQLHYIRSDHIIAEAIERFNRHSEKTPLFDIAFVPRKPK